MDLQVEHREERAWVHAGSVLRAHGVHGALRVRFEISPAQLSAPLEIVRLVPRKGAPQVMHLTEVREVHDGALVTLAELDNREAAQLLAGASVEIHEDLIPPVNADNAYVYELVGARVRDAAGAELGVVQRVADNGGQALLVLKHHGGAPGQEPDSERLLPLVPETFGAFDRQARVLTVKVPEGLWE